MRDSGLGNQVVTNREVFPGEFGKAERRTADPSTTLRSGRDDNFAWER